MRFPRTALRVQHLRLFGKPIDLLEFGGRVGWPTSVRSYGTSNLAILTSITVSSCGPDDDGVGITSHELVTTFNCTMYIILYIRTNLYSEF
jgi:hypothetical protein